MNKIKLGYAVFLLLLLGSCRAIAGIFKAGVWVGVIGVVILIALVLWLIGKSRKN